MRYHEEQAHDRGVPENALEHYVESVFDQLPTSIQVAHDQYRSRVDLYCSLVLVFALTGMIGITLLATYGREYVLVTAVLGAGLTWLSLATVLPSPA